MGSAEILQTRGPGRLGEALVAQPSMIQGLQPLLASLEPGEGLA